MGMYMLMWLLLASVVLGASTGVEERKAQALDKIPVRLQELIDVVIQCNERDPVTGLAQIINSTNDDTSKYIKEVVGALENSVTQAVSKLSDAIERNSDETVAQMKNLSEAVTSAQEGIRQMSSAITSLSQSLKHGCSGNGGGDNSNAIVQHGVIKCNAPFRNYNGQCLFISNSETDWHTAREKCKKIHGDLAENEDLEALINYVNLEGLVNTQYWIGGNDLKSPRNYHWVSGAKVTSGWRKDDTEPDYENPGNDCIYITNKGIGDVVCMHEFGYLCAA